MTEEIIYKTFTEAARAICAQKNHRWYKSHNLNPIVLEVICLCEQSGVVEGSVKTGYKIVQPFVMECPLTGSDKLT